MTMSPCYRAPRKFGDCDDKAGKLYFVRAAYGKLGDEWDARDPAHADWQTTVRHLAEGQWNDVRQVIEVDLARGTSADVTEAALACADVVRQMKRDGVCFVAL